MLITPLMRRFTVILAGEGIAADCSLDGHAGCTGVVLLGGK